MPAAAEHLRTEHRGTFIPLLLTHKHRYRRGRTGRRNFLPCKMLGTTAPCTTIGHSRYYLNYLYLKVRLLKERHFGIRCKSCIPKKKEGIFHLFFAYFPTFFFYFPIFLLIFMIYICRVMPRCRSCIAGALHRTYEDAGIFWMQPGIGCRFYTPPIIRKKNLKKVGLF